MQHMYPLAAIILNWNHPADTIACVESLQAAQLPREAAEETPALSIIVVDNGSSDDSVARLRQRFSTGVEVVELPANVGFAAGMNAGILAALQAGARSLLLLNNDTVVAPTMLAELLQAAHALPQAGILGPLIFYYAEPQRVWRFADREHPWLPIPLQLGAAALRRAADAPLQVDYVTGCAMLVRQAVFETTGLLDASYFMYYEDADFCRRARRDGFQVWCVPRAHMWHKVSLSASSDRPATRYMQAWGRAHFYGDHPHGLLPGMVYPYLLAKLLLTTWQDVRRRDWHLIAPLWRGTWEGIVGRQASARFRFAPRND